MKLIFKLIGFLLLSFGCSNDSIVKEPIHVVLAEKLINQYIDEVQTKYGVICFRSGGGFMDQVNRVSLSFYAFGPLTQIQLRKLLVNLTEDFQNKINGNVEIRDYLVSYPFPLSNINLRITIIKKNDFQLIKNKGTSKELLSYASLLEGKVRYSIQNDELKYYQDIYKESYEDALRLAQENESTKLKINE